jgi:Putative F0F1-ATPase subunit Ca2+/Mg2+ transporter
MRVRAGMLILADASRPSVVHDPPPVRSFHECVVRFSIRRRESREGLVSESDQRSPLSIGMGWASRIMGLSFEFSIPPLAGYFVDRWLGSNPIGILVGMVVGFLVGMLHILQIAKGPSKPG